MQVGLGDVTELETQFTGQLGHVPEHITQLQLQRFAHLRAEGSTLIAQHLFHLVGHFPCLTAEAEGGVDRIGSHVWITGRGAGTLLIGIEIHWQNRVGGCR